MPLYAILLLLQRLTCLIVLPECYQQCAEIGQRLDVRGSALGSVLECLHAFVQPALLLQRFAEAVPGFGVVGPEFQIYTPYSSVYRDNVVSNIFSAYSNNIA